MDPMTLVMLGLIGLLIIMMVRNGRKRREQAAQMQNGLVPGAQVMLQTGIYGTFLRFEEEDENRAVILSGESTLVVHRNSIGQIVSPVEPESEESSLAPDDDPAFGETVADTDAVSTDELPDTPEAPSSDDK